MTFRLWSGVLTAFVCWVSSLRGAETPTAAGRQNGWDRAAAAQYLDARIDLWFERASELRTGTGKTTCISCHTAVPYLLARPALRREMNESTPTAQEARLLKEMAQRVETYPDHESLSDPQHGGERATEAVLNALVLARHDAAEGRSTASGLTRKAFAQLWETQRTDGGWDWMDFGEEPDESRDSAYYGAALAAVAVGTVPGGPDAAGTEATPYLDKLRGYLRQHYEGQNLYNRTWLLLASTRLSDLLSRDQRQALLAELRAKQQADGGWCLNQLGPWKWSKTTGGFVPPGTPDLSLLGKSDGYATGLIVYTLRRARLGIDDPAVRKGLDWLSANQSEVEVDQRVWRCWRSYSLNHDREKGGSRGGPWKRMLMSDLATSYAVLALCPTD